MVQTVGQYRSSATTDQQAADHASGSAGVTGTLQIVTNPNAGGPGVPVSVWSRLDIDKHGTTNTCYADEFFRLRPWAARFADDVPGHGPLRRLPLRRLPAHRRRSATTASGINSLHRSTADCEGMDILDVEGNTSDRYNRRARGANYNVRSDASRSQPAFCEFPPDLFRYVFGIADLGRHRRRLLRRNQA